MDKPYAKGFHQLTRLEAVHELMECKQAFADYKFSAEQKIKDLQGEIAVLLEVDRNELLATRKRRH